MTVSGQGTNPLTRERAARKVEAAATGGGKWLSWKG
jgi:hypothetical protein